MTTHVRIPVGEVELSVATAGEGGRPLLLVHGFTGAKEDFGDWMDRLAAAGWWAVAPDLRGHGGSEQPAGEHHYALAHFVADLQALVAALGWERHALLGHSMGGMIAQELALAGPELLDGLVLMDTAGGPAEGLSPDVVATGIDYLRANGLEALLALLEQLSPGPRQPSEERVRAERPGFIEWSERKVRSCAPDMYAAMALELSTRPDRLPALSQLTVPTRVVVGAEDRNFLAPSRRLADTIPGADLVVIPDAAHSPQIENPEGWWDAVAPFLASLSAGSPASPPAR